MILQNIMTHCGISWRRNSYPDRVILVLWMSNNDRDLKEIIIPSDLSVIAQDRSRSALRRIISQRNITPLSVIFVLVSDSDSSWFATESAFTSRSLINDLSRVSLFRDSHLSTPPKDLELNDISERFAALRLGNFHKWVIALSVTAVCASDKSSNICNEAISTMDSFPAVVPPKKSPLSS